MDWRDGGCEDFTWARSVSGDVWAAVWQDAPTVWVACIIGGLRKRCESMQAAREWCEQQIGKK